MIVTALLACFTNTKRKFNKQSHARKSVRCVCAICPRFDGDAHGLCVEAGAGERLEFELETRELEQGIIARLSDKERRLFNWLSLRKLQWRQMRQRRENEARRREE